jgi:hypothetical protein
VRFFFCFFCSSARASGAAQPRPRARPGVPALVCLTRQVTRAPCVCPHHHHHQIGREAVRHMTFDELHAYVQSKGFAKKVAPQAAQEEEPGERCSPVVSQRSRCVIGFAAGRELLNHQRPAADLVHVCCCCASTQRTRLRLRSWQSSRASRPSCSGSRRRSVSSSGARHHHTATQHHRHTSNSSAFTRTARRCRRQPAQHSAMRQPPSLLCCFVAVVVVVVSPCVAGIEYRPACCRTHSVPRCGSPQSPAAAPSTRCV